MVSPCSSADEIDGIGDAIGRPNLTNPVTPTVNPVTNLINTKQQVMSIFTNLVISQRV